MSKLVNEVRQWFISHIKSEDPPAMLGKIIVMIFAGFAQNSYQKYYDNLPIEEKCQLLKDLRIEHMTAGDYVIMEECRDLNLLGKK